MQTWENGTRLGPYQLVERIGAGGMGEVWKAIDSRLERVVAIKRLSVQHSDRFEQESRAIAALNHPNICTLHDIGPDYLVMEYIDGVPLRGPLQVPEAVRLASQVAAALEAAHGKGVIHCDLKPANILVIDGRPKLLDFGVARVIRGDRDMTIDSSGAVIGTPAYMAPEQVQGKPPDERSDVFSFGAVLYELLSGRRAFRGDSMAETLSSVLRDDPPVLEAPGPLARIVTRCLEKVPAKRFQSIAEVTAALDQLLSAPVAQTPSIAVLPFTNMSSDPEQEYFSDGLTEEIINALAHVPGLKVIARTSAFAFKGQNIDIRRIAEALGVTNVLEGSVRKGGNRIRITAQLIKVDDGCHLWSERYDRELADVFAVQDEIAEAIATELRGKLAIDPQPRRTHTPSVDAYEAFLMAKHHTWKLTPESFEESRKCYEQAIALDPAYALAYAGLAELYHICSSRVGASGRDAAALIRPAAERALTIEPELPEAHAWLGIVATTYEYDWAEGERRFRRATAREPIAPRHRHMSGYFHLRFVGRAAEAVAEHQLALQEDPLNRIMRVGLAASLTSAGRHAEAAREAQRLMELDPDFGATYVLLALNVATEPLPVALAFAERGHAVAPWSVATVGLLAGLLRRAGELQRSETLRQQLGDPEEYGAAAGFALYHLACGESERAIDWLEKLVEQHHPFAMMILVGGPYAPILRESPRWPALVRRLNLPESRAL